jgi:hypothetical protein
MLSGWRRNILLAETRPDIIMGVKEIRYDTNPRHDGMTVISAAPLRFDSRTGAPSVFLAKFTRGSNINHTHPTAYNAIVVKGTMSRWSAGLPDAGTKRLEPGSYWYQPGKELHREECLSDECVLFVVTEGITDAAPPVTK